MENITKDIKNFIRLHLEPNIKDIEDYNYDIVKDLVKTASKLGFASISIPNEYGGLGGSVLQETQAVSQLCGISGSFDTGFIVQAGIGTRPIILFGNEEQKKKYVPKIAEAELFGSFALTEPHAGSDINNANTTAFTTDNGFLIRGEKTFISNAGWADFFIVFAKVDTDDKLTAFIVDKDDTIELGPEFDKLGIRASSTRTVRFKDTFVPKENMLYKRGEGFKVAMVTLNLGRLKLGAAVLQSGLRALNIAEDYAADREQFGRSILKYPIIKHKLDYNRRGLHRLGVAVTATAAEIDRRVFAGESKVDVLKDLAGEMAILKVAVSEAASKAIDDALQIMGGAGYMTDQPLEAMYRDVRIARIYEGTNEVCRLQSLMYLKKLGWYNKLKFKLQYGKYLKRMKKGADHIDLKIFELADKLINIYINKWNEK